MIKFPVAIVLYNPSNSTIERILYFLEMGIVFYVFDNSLAKNEMLGSFNKQNLNYCSFDKNLGLSYSIKYICELALSDHYENLLFFDQDTIFKLETLLFINNFLNFKENKSIDFFENILSVNFRDSDSVQNQLNVIENGVVENYTYYMVYFNINSGTLYFLDKFKNFEWFEKEYFVDGVDYSLSLSTVINKFKNMVIINVPGLNHTDEQGDSEISFCGRKISGRVYSFDRNYDFITSQLRLLKKTFKVKDIKPKLFLFKSISSYLGSQLIFRIHSIFQKK